jgi:hypothetical protein
MCDLILVGTVHLDPKNKISLYKTIKNFKPNILTVEISAFSVKYRLSNQKIWLLRLQSLINKLPKEKRGHNGLKLLELQLQMPLEWKMAYEYSKTRDIPCLAVDSGDLARNELPLWKNEILSKENLVKIINEPDFDLDDYFKECHSRAKFALERSDVLKRSFSHQLSWFSDSFWEKRESTLASRIKRIHKGELLAGRSRLRAGLHIHICGWMHLITGGPYKTLFELLSKLDPVRLFLTRPKRDGSYHLIS